MADKPKDGLTRVTFHYGDEEFYLVGAELKKWNDFNAIVARHAALDKVNPPWEDIVWKDGNEDKLY